MKSNLGIHLMYGVFGLAMGICLSYIGFADYDELFNMFTFTDTRMFFSFASAVTISMIVFGVLHLTKRLPFEQKHFHPGTIPGSIMFGFGWALCGACPSVVFIQLGQGKLAAVATLFGIYSGVIAYRSFHRSNFQWDTGSCGI
jgi:uncharacterized membrane protein YedE/YeeE